MASPATLADLARAAFYLGRARAALPRLSPADLLAMRQASGETLGSPWIARAAYAVPRVATWLPWRSDCLVQALAAHHWLAGRGIRSSMCMGVRKDGADFGAHAWLIAGETIVTGWPIDEYVPLDADDRRWALHLETLRGTGE